MNIIVKEGEIIGYYSDLKQYFKETLSMYADNNQWEEVKEVADIMLELDSRADDERLLVVDEHNGMGYTITEYKGE